MTHKQREAAIAKALRQRNVRHTIRRVHRSNDAEHATYFYTDEVVHVGAKEYPGRNSYLRCYVLTQLRKAARRIYVGAASTETKQVVALPHEIIITDFDHMVAAFTTAGEFAVGEQQRVYDYMHGIARPRIDRTAELNEMCLTIGYAKLMAWSRVGIILDAINTGDVNTWRGFIDAYGTIMAERMHPVTNPQNIHAMGVYVRHAAT